MTGKKDLYSKFRKLEKRITQLECGHSGRRYFKCETTEYSFVGYGYCRRCDGEVARYYNYKDYSIAMSEYYAEQAKI